MHAFLNHAIAFASDHALLAYALALVLAAAEALPVVGALVPGTAVIVAFGALIAAGALEFWPLAAAAVLGALLGDGFGYWLGWRYKDAAFRIWPLSNHPEFAERGAALFRKRGGTSVFIGRFTPGVRAVIPMLAGILAMRRVRFFSVDIVAAVLWAVLHILFGLLLGASLELLGAVTGRLAVLAAFLFVLGYAVIAVSRRVMGRLPRALARLAEPLAAWAVRNPGRPQRLLLRLLSTDRAEAFGLTVTATLIVGGGWLLLGALEGLLAHEPIARLDAVVLNGLGSLHADWADAAMRVFAAPGSTPALGLLAVGVLILLALDRQGLLALAWVVGLAASVALAFLLSLLPHATVPPTAGHPGNFDAMLAAASYGLLGLFVSRAVAPGLRPAIASALSLVVVFGAAARLYLGLSLFSTEVIAIAFALAWLGLVGFAAQLRRLPSGRALPVALVASVVIIAAVAAQAGGYGLVPAPVSPPPAPQREISLADWRAGGWASLPGSRVGLLGNFAQHFTLQWAGSLTDLSGALAARGWQGPPPWDAESLLAWLAPTIDPASLPVLPRFANGMPEALVLCRTPPPHGASSRHQAIRIVLRFWPSDTVVVAGDRRLPLWLGVVVEERFVRVAGTLTIVRSRRASPGPFATLAASLPHAEPVHENMVPAAPGRPEIGAEVLLGWEGASSARSP
ncbi:MAG TPA: VTT domain-containing protein [Acetobacteraceae bacterium]|jgi:membrane protein DedA with SNARE-associated domain|nr:VTT domain-containing protein [Acetobacteraceae bacterium]